MLVAYFPLKIELRPASFINGKKRISCHGTSIVYTGVFQIMASAHSTSAMADTIHVGLILILVRSLPVMKYFKLYILNVP